MRNIYTWSGINTKRNYTVYDLFNLKGKKRLTQANPCNADEADAAVEAKIDLMICLDKDVKQVRFKAPNHFLTAAILECDYVTKDEILKASMALLEKGADAIYTSKSPHVVEYLSKESVPVMAHLGLVPAKSTWSGGLRGIGKNAKEAFKLYQQYKDMENAGAFSVESEVIAEDTLREISKRTKMLTISLGSGNGGDVNYLFMCDICGENKDTPRHGIKFGNLFKLKQQIKKERVKALNKFRVEAKKNNFAKKNNIVSIPKDELHNLLKLIEKNRL